MPWSKHSLIIIITAALFGLRASEAFTFTNEPEKPTVVVEGVNSTLVRLIWEFALGPDESVLTVTFDRQKPGESMRTLIASRYGNTPFTFARVKFANKYRALLPATLVLLNVNKNEEFLYSLRVTYSRNAFVAQVNSQVAVIVHAFTITPPSSSLPPVTQSSVVPQAVVTLPHDLQRLFSNLLQSLREVIYQIGNLLGKPISPADVENFRNVTLQILQRVQNQLLASGPTDAGGLVKRAIPEVPNPLDLKELLEKMQRRLG